MSALAIYLWLLIFGVVFYAGFAVGRNWPSRRRKHQLLPPPSGVEYKNIVAMRNYRTLRRG